MKKISSQLILKNISQINNIKKFIINYMRIKFLMKKIKMDQIEKNELKKIKKNK